LKKVLIYIKKELIMGTSTVNISFRDDLLEQIDTIAKEESRSRSELIREAARLYIEKRRKWASIFEFGDKQAAQLNLKEEDIAEEIKKYRSQKKGAID
jgi:metal-responsive CopG/Arc/MetJ family transcriptional regulator